MALTEPYHTPGAHAQIGRVHHLPANNCDLCIDHFSCDQAALRIPLSVCPSLCLSVCLSQFFHFVPVIVSSRNFSRDIANDRSDVHAEGQGNRYKVKVTEVITQLSHFRTVTPDWIHIRWWNDAESLMMLKRGVLLFFKFIRPISRSHG